MIHRRRAYYGALKFHFQSALVAGAKGRFAFRVAYVAAKNYAAVYAFNASTDHLTTITV